jgi:S1-C subfamily serine protease
MPVKLSIQMVSLFACVGSLLMGLSTQTASSEIAPSPASLKAVVSNKSGEKLSLSQLRTLAQSITVKVIAGQTWGSGILIQKQGQNYIVLTNEHVLRLGDTYRIQTADGRIYTAQKNTSTQFNGDDLALLNFSSANSYNIATLATNKENYSLQIGDETFAAGFPAEDGKEFTFTSGKVSYLLPKAFLGGYQVGYSNDILKGMSGGPVLNRYGEVIGINGKHKNPLWGNTYIFKDGSAPVAKVSQQMDESSWAIPVQTFLQLAPQFSMTAVTPIPATTPVETVVPSPNSKNPESSQIRPSSFW